MPLPPVGQIFLAKSSGERAHPVRPTLYRAEKIFVDPGGVKFEFQSRESFLTKPNLH